MSGFSPQPSAGISVRLPHAHPQWNPDGFCGSEYDFVCTEPGQFPYSGLWKILEG